MIEIFIPLKSIINTIMSLVKRDILIYMLVVFLILMLSISLAYGDDEDEEEEGLFGEDVANQLGSAAWIGGLFLNSVFVVINRARKIFRLRVPMRAILDFHIITYVLLGIAGIIHGYSYLGVAGPAEYIAVGLILLLLTTGFFLRYVSSRKVRLLNRMVHGQLLLSIILAIVIGYHIAYIED